MAIEAGRGTVCGPPRVCDAAVRVEGLGQVDIGLVNELLELGHLANLLERKDLLLLVAVDGETGRVVPAVLETEEAYGSRKASS